MLWFRAPWIWVPSKVLVFSASITSPATSRNLCPSGIGLTLLSPCRPRVLAREASRPRERDLRRSCLPVLPEPVVFSTTAAFPLLVSGTVAAGEGVTSDAADC